MSNSTAAGYNPAQLLGAGGYIVEGAVFGVSNLLIGASVAKYSALNQNNQYFLLMSLALSDALNLASYVTAGSYRLSVMLGRGPSRLLTPVECLWKPHFFMMFSYPFSILNLVILSCDRLLLVSFPQFYILSLPSPRYSHLFVLVVVLFNACMVLMGVIGIYESPALPSERPLCLQPIARNSPSIFNRIYVYYYEHLSLVALASVGIFAAVVPIYKLRNQQTDTAEQLTQQRITKTVAASCMCTLFVFCIPDRLGYSIYYSGYVTTAMVVWLFSLSNPFFNFVIYHVRHYEMRLALKSLLRWKQMPATLNTWPKPAHLLQVLPVAHPNAMMMKEL